ncbi:LLM class flavin-dependent oxidoreductase [Planctomonas sp. JC2975]|uniref:LLM class flavin-dependent oxidoreductase n=1 Tax=Planctomonas sp. JC2975 TaxID=2729626 RepID=UPI003211CF05
MTHDTEVPDPRSETPEDGWAQPARAPLSVLDLAPFPSGSTPADGIRNTIDLAKHAERFGYARYWLAEHHANPGVSGSAPHVLAALVAAATDGIRVGTAATLLGNYSPIQVAEAAGVLGAYSGGRFDLGVGRAASVPRPPSNAVPPASTADAADRVVDGLVIPAPRVPRLDSERFAAIARLLSRDEGRDFAETVDAILGFLRGDYVDRDGVPVLATPAHDHGGVQVWVHGSTAGPSARLAGERGLRFGANYHVAPSFVLEAIEEYRSAFRPSEQLAQPHVIVSVDVVVADSDEKARRLAAGYAPWVLSIRSGRGAIPFPTPEQADAIAWSDEDRDAVRDRLDTQFVGSPATVAERLETLQRVTGAQELLVTTITHDHANRVNSYRLLAEAWGITACGTTDRRAS